MEPRPVQLKSLAFVFLFNWVLFNIFDFFWTKYELDKLNY